ncbi:MAG: NUDIX domain-containing protein [Clostridia bacterium]|nr:NUDIX domain-containing protein [Clostridia bacterium]
MQQEISCGAVVFTNFGNERRFVIIRGKKGFYGFPKGHMEAGETEKETALREIWEETGLHVQIIDGFRTEDEHPLIREGKPDTMKRIIYFTAVYNDQEPRAQESEISEIRLWTYHEAMEAFQFESSKRILNEAAAFLNETMSPGAIKQLK